METEKGKLVAQQEGLVKKTRIMVVIDESDESFHGLQWTLDNLFGCITATAAPEQPEANDEAGSRLITLSLVHVQQAFHLHYVPAGPGGTVSTAFYIPSSVEESVKKAQQQIAKALVSRASDMCKDKMNIEVETLVFEGDPKEKICRAAQEMHVDLLVIGSRNLGKFKRAFLGSVSDYCAQHANCPVLIVKSPKEASK
ncbi:hypothetical protein ES332_D04G116400v1 [Gossypium tomentosum]|uniref:UspA domain-containing protein n=1 Tax=Gossypium tomentosum TaxID=34277 RepID=A0A5D2LFF9_GOSTO|nr:hypothetical protein ES332_D04G116400v1 [Gossypium tomentosum]